ncbi:unnamed protein product [Camellia sinensis]
MGAVVLTCHYRRGVFVLIGVVTMLKSLGIPLNILGTVLKAFVHGRCHNKGIELLEPIQLGSGSSIFLVENNVVVNGLG